MNSKTIRKTASKIFINRKNIYKRNHPIESSGISKYHTLSQSTVQILRCKTQHTTRIKTDLTKKSSQKDYLNVNELITLLNSVLILVVYFRPQRVIVVRFIENSTSNIHQPNIQEDY